MPLYSYRGDLSSDLDHSLAVPLELQWTPGKNQPPQTQFFLAKLGKATLSVTTVEDMEC